MSLEYDRDSGQIVKLTTLSGIPVKTFYGPDDVEDLSCGRDLGNPGEYPYTRGIFPEMYRKRLWLK